MKLDDDLNMIHAGDAGDFQPGCRSARRARSRRRKRGVGIVLVVALLGGGAWAGRRLVGGGAIAARHPVTVRDAQTAYAFMIRRGDDPTRRTDMLAVFGLDAGGRNPVTLLIPSSALTEIPGHGPDAAGKGFSFGSQRLQNLVVDNMLGIRLDGSVAMTDGVFARLVDASGGIDIEISSPLYRADSASGQQLVPEFDAGRPHMDGATVTRFLHYQGGDETELSRLARARQVWDGLINAWSKIGVGALAQKIRSFGTAYDTGIETGISPLDLAEFFEAFAVAGDDNRVTTTLPVLPVQAGGEAALRVDESNVAPLVQQYFAGSIPVNPFVGTRIAVLNGNGVPEVGVQVALRVVPEGFKIVVNKNADTFAHDQTKITVYSRNENVMNAARRVRDLLGVGQIQIGLQSQSVVDLTVVVGRDFPPVSNSGTSGSPR